MGFLPVSKFIFESCLRNKCQNFPNNSVTWLWCVIRYREWYRYPNIEHQYRYRFIFQYRAALILTNIMVVPIMNNKVCCFNHSILRVNHLLKSSYEERELKFFWVDWPATGTSSESASFKQCCALLSWLDVLAYMSILEVLLQ